MKRTLPLGLLLAALIGLGVFAWRVVVAESVLAEKAARAELRGRAREAAAGLAQLAAELSREVAGGERAAVLDAAGRFVRPREPAPLRPLAIVPGRDPEGRFYLELAAEAETREANPVRAEEVYRLAASPARDETTRRIALHRLHALLKRQGRGPEAEITRRAFLESLEHAGRRRTEALVHRAQDPDEHLEDDLLSCLGGRSDAIVLGILASLPSSDPAALAGRRQEIARMARLRALVGGRKLEDSGVLFREGRVLAWMTTPEGELRLAEATVPTPGPDLRILAAGETPVEGDHLVEAASVGALLPGVRIVAHGPRRAAEAEARRRAAIVVGALGLLLIGAGGTVILGFRAVRRETAAARARSEFLTRVGHDLRTPLARMRLFAETMAAGRVTDPDEVREFATVVQRDSERLSNLVRITLDLSRVEKALATKALDLAVLLEETADAHRPLLERDGVEIALETPGGPVTVEGDADALRGAIGNLIENAWRHAATGGRVEVTLGTRDDRAEVIVADRGPGLPAGLGDRIFERFVRGPDATSVGTGLGLALVSEVAAAHGGAVRAENRSGEGARFVLTLPLRREHS